MPTDTTVQDTPIQQPPSKAEKLYSNLTNLGFTEQQLGKKDEFEKAIQNPLNANKIYSGLRSAGLGEQQIGTLKEFQTTQWVEKKSPVANDGRPTSPLSQNGGQNVPGFRKPNLVATEKTDYSDFLPKKEQASTPAEPIQNLHVVKHPARLLTTQEDNQAFGGAQKPIPHKVNPNQNVRHANSWENLGDFVPNTVMSGIEKDGGDALKFLGGYMTKNAPQNQPISDILNQLGTGLEKYSQEHQQQADEHQLPNTAMGGLTSGVTNLAPTLLELALTPELDVAKVGKLGEVLTKYGGKYAPKAVSLAAGKFPLLMGSKGLVNGYADAVNSGMPDADATKHAALNSAEEYGKGLLFEAAGEGAGKLTKLGIKAAEDAGWMADGKILSTAQKAIMHSTAQAAGFSAVPFITNALQGKGTSLDELKHDAILGGVMGAISSPHDELPTHADNAATQVIQRSPIVDLHNFMSADMPSIEAAHTSEATPADLGIKSAAHADAAFKSDDPEIKQQEVVQSSVAGKLASVKSITNAIIEDKDAVVDAVHDLPVSDDVKAGIIDKVNQVSQQIDPVEKEKTDISGKINELDEAISNNEDRPEGTPIEAADKKVVGERLQKERDDLSGQLEKTIAKQYDYKVNKPRYVIKGDEVTPKQEEPTPIAKDETGAEPSENKSLETSDKEIIGEPQGGEDDTNKQEEKAPEQPAPKPSDRAKSVADKIRSLKSDKSSLHGGLQGVGAAIWDGALETAATTIEAGGKVADAIQSAVAHIKANSKETDEDKIRKSIADTLSEAGIEDRYEDPDMIEANNAYMDAKVEGKFGQDALDSIIGKLQDTNLKNIVEGVKGKIKENPKYLESTRSKVLDRGNGSEEDQAALLMDQFHLKEQENALIDGINKTNDPAEIKDKQAQLSKVQNDILDNATANRLIGRQASTMFRLRQVAVDNDANLQSMREKYMASEGVKKLSSEQEEEVKQAYQRIRDAEQEVKRIKSQEKQTRYENERLQKENDALKKIIDEAKRKHTQSKATTTDRLIKIRSDLDGAKKRLSELTNRVSANAILNPELYKELKNIAVAKTEELYVKTKSAIELNSLVKSVLDEIKDIAPDITERDVRDAISGNHSTTKPRLKNDLQKNVAELKRQAKILNNYQDMIDGKLDGVPKLDQPEAAKLQEERKQDPDLDTKKWNTQKYKAIQKQIAEVQGKLDRKEFTTPQKEAKKYEKSDKLKEAERELAVRKFLWDKGRQQAMMKNEPWYKRYSDNILRWQRFAILSYPSTALKLMGVAAKGVLIKPFQLAFQEATYQLMHGIGKLTGREGASGAIYGKVRAASVAKFYSEFVRNFSAENLKHAFQGIDEADILHGSGKYMDDYDMGSGFANALLEFPGRSHGYIKSFLKKPETAFAHEQLIQDAIEKSAEIEKQLKDPNLTDAERSRLTNDAQKYDLSNDENLERINALAAEHGKWSIMMSRNYGVEKLRGFMGGLTGNKDSWATKAVGYALKSELPIIKLPVNYARRYFLMKYGLIKAVTGGAEMDGLAKIAFKGTDGLSDKNKELLSRTMTYGSMGAAGVVAGVLLRNHVIKNKDGSVDIGDTHIPKLALDYPLDDSFLSGVTFGQNIEKMQGKDGVTDWITKYAESDIDVVKRMPFTNMLTYGFIEKLAQGISSKTPENSTNQIRKAWDEKVAGMITPGMAKELAEQLDKPDGTPKFTDHPVDYLNTPTVKRQPKSLWENIKTAIPFARQTVSTHSEAFDKKLSTVKNDDGEKITLTDSLLEQRKQIIKNSLSTDSTKWIDTTENRKAWEKDFNDYWQANPSELKKVAKKVAQLKSVGASLGKIKSDTTKMYEDNLQKYLETRALQFSADSIKNTKPFSILNK